MPVAYAPARNFTRSRQLLRRKTAAAAPFLFHRSNKQIFPPSTSTSLAGRLLVELRLNPGKLYRRQASAPLRQRAPFPTPSTTRPTLGSSATPLTALRRAQKPLPHAEPRAHAVQGTRCSNAALLIHRRAIACAPKRVSACPLAQHLLAALSQAVFLVPTLPEVPAFPAPHCPPAT